MANQVIWSSKREQGIWVFIYSFLTVVSFLGFLLTGFMLGSPIHPIMCLIVGIAMLWFTVYFSNGQAGTYELGRSYFQRHKGYNKLYRMAWLKWLVRHSNNKSFFKGVEDAYREINAG